MRPRARAPRRQYIFLENDLLAATSQRTKWALTALLNDGQYGDPQTDQWATNYKIQFRHPMAIFYDDRWSAVVTAYVADSDRMDPPPASQYRPPRVTGPGVDRRLRVEFKGWGQ